ncbi:unnamed protein product [Lepeophtheirus salmonis]|uniref:(salmon louse) hypothetical protein n=1 Tax=Lepeophtheirus salmonis TaxID=72036 RepID=A0A817FCI7_LEPSM|nr:unnamed protein product [Lepeophtheirus salmonis]
MEALSLKTSEIERKDDVSLLEYNEPKICNQKYLQATSLIPKPKYLHPEKKCLLCNRKNVLLKNEYSWSTQKCLKGCVMGHLEVCCKSPVKSTLAIVFHVVNGLEDGTYAYFVVDLWFRRDSPVKSLFG